MDKCFLCGRSGPLECHHIFGAANRDKSERFGLTVQLCAHCHREGPEAVHRSAETMQLLHEFGPRLAMHRYGWSAEQFMASFGKNYLDL